MSYGSDVQMSEMASWVRELVAPMIQERVDALRQELREDGLRRLEHSLTVVQKRAEERFDRLETALAGLAEAQGRTEQRVEELAQAQKRTEQRVEELAQAQRRTEEHLAQVATTQRSILKRLDSVEHQVGALSNAVGVDAEADAVDTLVYVLGRKGYRLLETPYALAVDGEVDVVVEAETPGGESVSVLVEAKARARLKELYRWSERLEDSAFRQKLIDAGVSKPFLPYLFGLRVYQIVDNEARKLGIGVLDPNQGERVAPTILY